MKYFQERKLKILKKITLFLLINISLLGNKNFVETKFLEETIVVGIVKNENFQRKNKNGISITDLTKDIFLKELKLNVVFLEKDYNELEEMLKNKEIHGIIFINRDIKISETLVLAETIFTKNIYVGSDKIPLNSLDDLNGYRVYYEKNNHYLTFFIDKIKNNDINLELIETSNIERYKSEIVLTPLPNKYNLKNRLRVTSTSGYTIGLDRKYAKLVESLNEILNKKYKLEINNLLEDIYQELSIKAFIDSLTDSEYNYLNQLKTLNVSYEDIDLGVISYWSKDKEKYNGIFPKVLERIGQFLDIRINYHQLDKQDSLNALKKGKLDTIILSKTEERTKDYIFSKKITNLNTYVISRRDNNSQKNRVGVLRNHIEENIAKVYDNSENIKSYSNYKLLKKALDEGEIEYILTINKSNFDLKKYRVRQFEEIPINFAFNLNNLMLQNIINKALIYLIEIDVLKKEALLELELENLSRNVREKKQKIFLYFLLSTAMSILIYGNLKLKREEKEREKLLKDPLTGLSSRERFNRFCLEKKVDMRGFVFVVDLNNFKIINDTKGHEFGDEILIEFGNFLRDIWKGERIFRISGDEYYGFLEEEEEEEEIILKFKSYKKYCPLMKENNISFSLGLCSVKNGRSLKESFRYADLVMLENKNNIEFNYGIVNKDFILSQEKEMKILEELKNGINNFYPVYQPKFSLKSNKIVGAEALARFYSDKLGHIYPDEFIKIAEKNEIIYKIDYIIAEKSMFYLKEKIQKMELPKDFKISFNLSVQTLERDDVVIVLKDLLNKIGISAKNLEIEITESIFIIRLDKLIMKLKELKKLGFTISLDDFMAGHSTASVLSLLPIDNVKFDKSLLDSIETVGREDKARKVYETLTSLIQGLDVGIVSEGVETIGQLEYLDSLGVQYVQGYFISKPISEKEMSLIVKSYGGNI